MTVDKKWVTAIEMIASSSIMWIECSELRESWPCLGVCSIEWRFLLNLSCVFRCWMGVPYSEISFYWLSPGFDGRRVKSEKPESNLLRKDSKREPTKLKVLLININLARFQLSLYYMYLRHMKCNTNSFKWANWTDLHWNKKILIHQHYL